MQGKQFTLSELKERTAVRFQNEKTLFRGVMLGYAVGLVMTITFVLVYQKAMPALLFILPMQLVGVFTAAYGGYGPNGVSYLLKFDEEVALKTGQSMAAPSKLPLK